MEHGTIVNNNIYIDQGTDFYIEFIVAGLSETSTFQGFAKRVYSEGPMFPIVVEYKDGVLTLNVESDITSTLRPGKYYYDIIERNEEGRVRKVLSGLATVMATMSMELTWNP